MICVETLLTVQSTRIGVRTSPDCHTPPQRGEMFPSIKRGSRSFRNLIAKGWGVSRSAFKGTNKALNNISIASQMIMYYFVSSQEIGESYGNRIKSYIIQSKTKRI